MERILSGIADKGGVYRIINKINGNPYIGSAKCFKARCSEHERLLKSGKHHSKKLQHAWDKYKEDAFVFEVLEVIEEIDEIVRRTIEQKYLDEAWPNCYNTKKKTIQKQGPWSSTPEETRKKISEAMKGENNPNYGKLFSAEHKKKLSEAQKNREPFSEETRKKLSDAHKGKTTWNKGKKFTEAQKKKLRGKIPWNKGKTGIYSEETKQKMREAKKGKPSSFKGKKHTEEAKRKNSEAHKGKKIKRNRSE